jgi:glycosyltransferase involved in cell wall biosynthesis
MPKTIVVVPCYNEAERLDSESFARAAELDPTLSFILVDDGSKDATRSTLEQLATGRRGQITVLGLDQNRGKAEAVRQGMLIAFEQSPELVAYFDADLATPIAELTGMRELFARSPELQVVLGSRVGLLGRDVVRSHARHYLGRGFATLASLSLGLTVYDTQCGAKMFRDTPAIRSVFAQPFNTRWTFDVEILARLNALAKEGLLPPLAMSGAEYPLTQWHDVSGSKLGTRAALGAGLEIASLWLRYRRGWIRSAR